MMGKLWVKNGYEEIKDDAGDEGGNRSISIIWTECSGILAQGKENDGRIEIDNNLIENKIRPLALGRKNYLFSGTHERAEGYLQIPGYKKCSKL